MKRILALVLAALLGASIGYAEAAEKGQKKLPSERPKQTQEQPKPSNNVYGAGCKNQGASIMSGGCVN
jgi:hypothetical protein